MKDTTIKINYETSYLLKELACYNNTNKKYMLEYLIRKACNGKKISIVWLQ